MPHDPDAIPVIVGVGELADRAADPAEVREPAGLMHAALLRAEADAGAALLDRLDRLSIINEISWPYADPVGVLCDRLRHRPAHAAYGRVGGETPVAAIHAAAQAIARGEARVAAVCGAESEHAVRRAAASGVALPWSPRDPDFRLVRASESQRPQARMLGLAQPTNVYPLYENAWRAARGESGEAGRRRNAALWSRFSQVAAGRAEAWLRRPHDAAEIATPTAANRLIAWPYTKLMVANPLVNQGAAIVLVSLAEARRRGIPASRCVRVLGGAAAAEPDDLMARDGFAAVPAMQAVLDAAPAVLPRGVDGFDAVELYSCFPCVPAIAAAHLGLPDDATPTLAGGLTFFGAPLNNYMAHAAVAMVERLRAGGARTGLLYGQGGYATKHHALVLAAGETDAPPPDGAHDVQADADRRRGAVPAFAETHDGEAVLETYTVLYDRDGAPRHGVVVARPTPGTRIVARSVASDDIAALASLGDSPVGRRGVVRAAADGVMDWTFV